MYKEHLPRKVNDNTLVTSPHVCYQVQLPTDCTQHHGGSGSLRQATGAAVILQLVNLTLRMRVPI